MKEYFVYIIKNYINNKVYIGITSTSIKNRWKCHLKDSTIKNRHYKLYNAIKKYGKENFYIKEIDTAKSWKELCEKEIKYISLFNSFNNGYNCTLGGEGNFGHKATLETKKKMSLKRKGKLNGMYGKISPMRGKKQRPETIEKMRTAKLLKNWQKGRPSWNKGKIGLATSSQIEAIKLAQSIPVTIDGIQYKSKKEAGISLGLNKYYLNKKLWALRKKI